jgi:hypothetical protein
MDRVEFLKEIQKDEGDEDHGIDILTYDNISNMHSTTRYWGNIVEESREIMEEEWDACNQTLEKDQPNDD